MVFSDTSDQCSISIQPWKYISTCDSTGSIQGCKGGWNHNQWKYFLGSRDKRVISYANTSLWRNNILPYRKSRVWVCEQSHMYLYCMEEYTDDDLQTLVIIYSTRYKPYARIERVQRLQSYRFKMKYIPAGNRILQPAFEIVTFGLKKTGGHQPKYRKIEEDL